MHTIACLNQNKLAINHSHVNLYTTRLVLYSVTVYYYLYYFKRLWISNLGLKNQNILLSYIICHKNATSLIATVTKNSILDNDKMSCIRLPFIHNKCNNIRNMKPLKNFQQNIIHKT